MSMQCTLEFSLHIHSFRNIDLFHQGLYKLQTSITTPTLTCRPYRLHCSPKRLTEDPHRLTESMLNSTYIETPTFLLRYFDEVVRLDTIYYFRLELDAFNHTDFTLTFSLLFNDLKGKVSPEEALSTLSSQPQFEVASTSTFSLKFPTSFQSLYIPAIFDDNHCSLVVSTLQYLLVDFKATNVQSGANLAYAVFPLQSYIPPSAIDSTFIKYMQPLSLTYASLRDHYLLIFKKCLTQIQRQSLQLYYIPPILNLPDSRVQLFSSYSDSLKNLPSSDSDTDSVSEESPTILSKFSQRVVSRSAENVSTLLLSELSAVSHQIIQLWRGLNEISVICAPGLMEMLKERYEVSKRQRLSASVIRSVRRCDNVGVRCNIGISDANKYKALTRRKENQGLKDKFILDERFLLDDYKEPILIEEYCVWKKSWERLDKRNQEGVHLLVLVHGLHGSSYDMRVIKNMLSVNFQGNAYLCSSCNEADTESSVFELGRRLAEEVNCYIKDNCIVRLKKISFIGHSLGGLIIRAALPHLHEFSTKMHLFLSLSCPHLGIFEGCSRLIRAGLWVLNNLKKRESLKQLSFSDSIHVQDSAMYKLSNEKGCEWFTHLVLISSPQDLYSPHYSARIETTQDLEKYGKNGKLLEEMAKSILAGRSRVHRIDSDFVLPSNNFDNWIGRAGHIEFLENRVFITTLAYMHPEFFE